MQFVSLVKFTPNGIANVKGSTQRAKKFMETAESAGVKIHELLWTQGAYDGMIRFEAPDMDTAAATMLRAAADGNVQTETMVAFDADGFDQVLGKMP